MAGWHQDVTDALANLGGTAALDDLYAEVRRIRPGPHPESFEEIIRRTLEEHSSDSRSFRGTNAFYSVDGLGKGVWGLRAMSPNVAWAVDPGTEVRRAAIHDTYGGARRGGIEPSAKTPNVLIFSEPEKSSEHTYLFDGWAAPDLLHYTGEGPNGDQRFVDGNRAIRDHLAEGRSLRVFRAKPPMATYLGQFRIDNIEPYFFADSPGRDGLVRQEIVFRLRPVGAFVDGGLPVAPPRPTSQQSVVIDAPAGSVGSAVLDIPAEEVNVAGYRIAPPDEPIEALRREAALVTRYQAWLTSHGHAFGRNRVLIPGELGSLYTDLFDKTDHELIEAKASAARSSVRIGLGQLLDYARFVEHTRKSLLLPAAPRLDLVELLHAHGCGCIWEASTGHFVRSDP